MSENKWEKFRNDDLYEIQDLGRPAIFLLPVKKLDQFVNPCAQGTELTTVKDHLHKFLLKNFNAYTTSTIPSFGVWKGLDDAIS